MYYFKGIQRNDLSKEDRMSSIGHVLLGFHWLVPVGIFIVVAFVGVRWLGKHLANQPDQIKRLLTNFGFCAAIATILAAFTDHLRFDVVMFGVFGIGVLNGVANIQVWRATRTSLSKTSLLAFGDDIIAVLLSIAIIGDGQYLNGLAVAGMTLCFAAGVLFWWHDASKKKQESSAFYTQVLIYSVLWGIAIFAERFYAYHALPVVEFLFGWYGGSFAVMLVAFAWDRRHGGGTEAVSFNFKDYALVAVFAVSIMLCLAIAYWAFTLAPQTAVIPVLLAAEATIPTIVGWTIFKERKLFDRWQWGFSALAIVGTILLGISLPRSIV